MKIIVGILKKRIKLTEEEIKTITGTEKIINEMADLKRVLNETDIDESQAKYIKTLFDSLIDFVSMDYED